MNTTIQDTLRSIGIHGRYRGHRQAAVALQLMLQDQSGEYDITEVLFAEVARICQGNPDCIERNIRTVIFRAWRTNRKRLIEIAGYQLIAPPTVSEFLDILANHIRRQTEPHPAPVLTGTWRDY